MADLTLNSEYAENESAKLVQGWLSRIFEQEPLSESAGVLAKVLLNFFNGEQYPMSLCMLNGLSAEDFTDALRLIQNQREVSVEPHAYFVRGTDIFGEELPERCGLSVPSKVDSVPSVLPKKFNPSAVQWEYGKKRFPLDILSRDDLLQVSCECIEVLERMDTLQHSFAQLAHQWRYGEVFPSKRLEGARAAGTRGLNTVGSA